MLIWETPLIRSLHIKKKQATNMQTTQVCFWVTINQKSVAVNSRIYFHLANLQAHLNQFKLRSWKRASAGQIFSESLVLKIKMGI